MGTGLIFAAIVIAWAVFLVPWALRRYDEAARTRSVEKFSQAMRVLGRRTDASDDEDADESAPVAAPSTLRANRPEPDSAVAGSVRRPSRAAARAAARQRRRVLGFLLASTAILAALAGPELVPGWSVAVGASLVVTYIVVCRLQVRRADDATWDQRRAAEPERPRPATRRSRRAARVDSAYGSAPRPGGDDPDDEPTVDVDTAMAQDTRGRYAVDPEAPPVADDDLVEETAMAVTVSTDDGDALWDPLPVTLPTYVSKQRADRTVRTIDLDHGDAWTSGRVEGERTEMPARDDSDSDGGPEHRRAVGD